MFKFELEQVVGLKGSAEGGEITGRAEYANGENQYYIRYLAGDSRLVESWWGESALCLSNSNQ